MNRYDESTNGMDPDTNGDWCLFEDHEKELKVLTEAMQKQAAYITRLEKIINNMDAELNEVGQVIKVI